MKTFFFCFFLKLFFSECIYLLLTVKNIYENISKYDICVLEKDSCFLLTLLHSNRPKLYSILAILSAVGFMSVKEKIL